MGNCCKGRTPSFLGPGPVVNLTAIQDAATGSVLLQWAPPMHDEDQVTGYDVRFKPVGAAHYTYAGPLDNPRQLRVTLKQSDGLPPLTRCNFEVRAKVYEKASQWSTVIHYVEWACRLPGCFTSRLQISRTQVSAFCCRDHAKQCTMEYCLFYECQTAKSREQGPQYHFCSPFHLRMAKIRNLSALMEINGPNSQFKDLCKLFSKRWAKGSHPVIQSVLELINPAVQERFAIYTDNLPRRHRKVEQYFHGTMLSCNILEHLIVCSDSPQSLDECEACGIIENGFEMRKIGNTRQRFGPGFYLSSKSSKAGDYCRGPGTSRAMFLCDVSLGKKYELRTSNPGLTAPPSDYHSVCGKSKFLGTVGDLNCDEYVLYSEGAIRPRYLFIFRVCDS